MEMRKVNYRFSTRIYSISFTADSKWINGIDTFPHFK